jgi:hypothetical protein
MKSSLTKKKKRKKRNETNIELLFNIALKVVARAMNEEQEMRPGKKET